MALGSASPRFVALLGLAGVLAYTAWIGGPYLYSIIVRDAAVTTWINHAAAPIAGHLDPNPRFPGERVGNDRRIATVEDPLADATALTRARAELERARARATTLAQLVESLKRVIETRAALAAGFADSFKRDLDSRIAAARSNAAFMQQRLDLERTQASRLSSLLQRGAASQAAVDATIGRVTDHERSLIEIRNDLDRTTVRRQAAEAGSFILEDGTDAGVAIRNLEDVRLRLIEAESNLAIAQADAESAQHVLDASQVAYDKARAMIVGAPPGALVWSLIASPGSAVQPGTAVAAWIDCRVMMVDVPVSDVETALLRNGAPAEVVLEGETLTRRGVVILTRGAAAILGQSDLAALAKGRNPGTGQALVKLEPTAADIDSCPVGHAAYVHFPNIGLIDIIRTRLRL